MWDPGVIHHKHHPSMTSRDPVLLGVDAGIKHDNAVRAAVMRDENGEWQILVSLGIGSSRRQKSLNLEQDVS
jgi:hypothetical protein